MDSIGAVASPAFGSGAGTARSAGAPAQSLVRDGGRHPADVGVVEVDAGWHDLVNAVKHVRPEAELERGQLRLEMLHRAGPDDGRCDGRVLQHEPQCELNQAVPGNQQKVQAVGELTKVADDAGLSLIQLALGFVLEHPAVTSPIIGPRTMEHLESQLPALELRLGSDVLDRIDEIVPPGIDLNDTRRLGTGRDRRQGSAPATALTVPAPV